MSDWEAAVRKAGTQMHVINDILCVMFPDLGEQRELIRQKEEETSGLRQELNERLLWQVAGLTEENLTLKKESPFKRHLTVAEAARLYGYTQKELRRLAIEERKLRYIPAGEGQKKQRIKFDRLLLEEDFADLTVTSQNRKAALDAKNRPQRRYVNPNKAKYV